MELRSDELTLPLQRRMVSNQLRIILLASDSGSMVTHLFQELVAVVVRVKNRLLILLYNM